MLVNFSKYHGTGNDFLLFDNRTNHLGSPCAETISKWTQRRFGVGADGVILIENASHCDFEMKYFNGDGSILGHCGNGSRCAVQFAKRLGMAQDDHVRFLAVDGEHQAWIRGDMVEVTMRPVHSYKAVGEGYFLDSGSPHFIVPTDDISSVDVVKRGREIRNRPEFHPHGANVNFLDVTDKGIQLRTYERGVEDETLSCGTGVVASAILVSHLHRRPSPVEITTRGGTLRVNFRQEQGNTGEDTSPLPPYSDIRLSGPAQIVFDGTLEFQKPQGALETDGAELPA